MVAGVNAKPTRQWLTTASGEIYEQHIASGRVHRLEGPDREAALTLLRARRDEVRRYLDDLVSQHPSLKAR